MSFKFFNGFKGHLTIVIIGFLISCSGSEIESVNTGIISTTQIEIESVNDIVDLSDSLIAPILYSHIHGLDALPIPIKKEKFIAALLPAILVTKYKLKQQEDRLLNLIQGTDWKKSDSLFFDELSNDYKITDASRLLSAIKTHPNSIVLAQAVVESGWGNSRIFATANNLFGIWSFNKNEPRIPSNIKRGSKTIYLRKYADISESIADYFTTIGRTSAYQLFREERLNTNDPFVLTPFLDHYSERRQAYVDQLNEVIRYNDLTKYDNYQIDPAYISY